MDKVALGHVFPRVFLFSPVNFIPSVLQYTEKGKKLIIFIAGLYNKPQGCGASVASAAGPFTTKKRTNIKRYTVYRGRIVCHTVYAQLIPLLIYPVYIFLNISGASCNQIEKNEVGGACSTYGVKERCIQHFDEGT
jgi:hypothetical protein